MNTQYKLYIIGGTAGVLAFIIATLISNMLFFQVGNAILFNPTHQSSKVLEVLFQMEPLPLMFTNGLLYMLIGAGIGFIHGLVFVYLLPALPRSTCKRGVAYGIILWVLLALYFEFHAPFNMFGEPLWLVGIELIFWIIVLLIQGITTSWLYSKMSARIQKKKINGESIYVHEHH